MGTISKTLSYLAMFKKEYALSGLLLTISVGIEFLHPLVIQQITEHYCPAGRSKSSRRDNSDPDLCEHT